MSELEQIFSEFTLNYNFLWIGLFLFIACDFFTGILKAYKTKEVVSSKLRDGGFKKGGIILVCFIGYFLSFIFNAYNHIISNSVLCYYIYTELVSIIENLNEMGIPLPPIIKKIVRNSK